MSDVFSAIGERIKVAREERGWTQAQLGEAIGYTQATIGNYELGRRHVGIDDLYKIAEALGKPYAYFIGADRQLEEQAKQDAENKVRRDMAGFVGVRMMPVLFTPLAKDVPLSPGDIETHIPIPREFGRRADLIVRVDRPCAESIFAGGEYAFIRREHSGQQGQIVLASVDGCVGLATLSPEGGYLWTASGLPVGALVTIVGEFCGMYTEGGLGATPAGEPGPEGWADLNPEDQQQVREYIEFLRLKRARG